ncbi:glutathione S-transferase [Cryptosporidium ryanae]|uniref:glutathione S-transferase n=1 Tax=Cryptosporidium ryanae TaxID=515981 RepID=UPI00351A081B|nr:glutathione S-transferase [Cryptosporidium ryanae]
MINEGNEISSPRSISMSKTIIPFRLTSNRIMIPSRSAVRVVLPVRDIGELTVITFEHDIFVGNGGSIRFFLLGKQVRHRFVNVPLDEEKPIPSYIDSSRVPLGDLPIIKLGDLVLFDEIPCLRYLAKKLGEYGRNYYVDFVIDDIILRCSRWRDIIMELIPGSNTGVSAKSYIEETNSLSNYKLLREQFYYEFETLITCIGDSGIFIADSNRPMICDFILFSILFDDISLVEIDENNQFNRTTMIPENSIIHRFPRLKILFESISSLPLIEQWIKGKYFLVNIESESNIGDLITQKNSFPIMEHTNHFFKKEVGNNQSSRFLPPIFQQPPNQIFGQATAGIRFLHQPINHINNLHRISPSNSFGLQPQFHAPQAWMHQINGNCYFNNIPSPIQSRSSPSPSFRIWN